VKMALPRRRWWEDWYVDSDDFMICSFIWSGEGLGGIRLGAACADVTEPEIPRLEWLERPADRDHGSAGVRVHGAGRDASAVRGCERAGARVVLTMALRELCSSKRGLSRSRKLSRIG